MALSITYTPPSQSSVQDDLIYTVADAAKVVDPVTYANFKFIGDVYIGATLVARIKRVPDPTTGIGVFNIAQIVRNYLNASFDPVAAALVAQESGDAIWTASVTMHFGEEWNYTPTYDIIVDSTRLFFNNYNGRLIGLTSSLIGKSDKVITNSPFTRQVLLSSPYFFVPYFPTSTGAVSVIVTPAGGGSGFTTSFTPSGANVQQLLNISPSALNAVHAGTITAATISYKVQIGGQTFTVQIICESIYQPYMLHFLNQYGGFDSRLFTKVSRKTVDITRKDFGKLPYTVDGSGNVSYKTGNGVYNEKRSVYSSLYQEKMVLNSDLLTDAEYAWLEELVVSPMVYMEDGGYFYPISIADSNYEARKYVNDDLTSLTLNIQIGNPLNTQFR